MFDQIVLSHLQPGERTGLEPVAKPARHLVMQFFSVYRAYKESISKEVNYDNVLNLHSMTKLSGWLRYWVEQLLVEFMSSRRDKVISGARVEYITKSKREIPHRFANRPDVFRDTKGKRWIVCYEPCWSKK